MPINRSVRLVITGRVQGVGYRYSFAAEAQRHELTGWVANRNDGAVEAVVAGEENAIDAIVAWAHRGPSGARVDAVEVTLAEDTFSTFEIRASF